MSAGILPCLYHLVQAVELQKLGHCEAAAKEKGLAIISCLFINLSLIPHCLSQTKPCSTSTTSLSPTFSYKWCISFLKKPSIFHHCMVWNTTVHLKTTVLDQEMDLLIKIVSGFYNLLWEWGIHLTVEMDACRALY